MSASVDSVGTQSMGVQTWPLIDAGAVAAVPLPAHAGVTPSPEPAQTSDGVEVSNRHPRESGDPATLATDRTSASAEAKTLDSRLRGNDGGIAGQASSQAVATASASQVSTAATLTQSTAQTTQSATFGQPQTGAGMVGTTIVTLLLVIGFILLLAWLAKRMPGIGASANPALKVVGSLSLGPRERVVVVAVGDTQLLLSTGPGGTRALHTLEQPLPTTPAGTSPFAQVLAQQFGKKKS